MPKKAAPQVVIHNGVKTEMVDLVTPARPTVSQLIPHRENNATEGTGIEREKSGTTVKATSDPTQPKGGG